MSETPTPSLLQDWLREKAHVPYFAAYRGDLLSIAHALDSLHSALTSERAAKDEKERAICRLLTIESELRTLLQDERAARERAEAERDTLLARVRDDALVMTCQSIGQYRTALMAKEGS